MFYLVIFFFHYNKKSNNNKKKKTEKKKLGRRNKIRKINTLSKHPLSCLPSNKEKCEKKGRKNHLNKENGTQEKQLPPSQKLDHHDGKRGTRDHQKYPFYRDIKKEIKRRKLRHKLCFFFFL